MAKENLKFKNSGLFQAAKRYLAAGVNSPVRSFKYVGGEPVFIKSGHGSKICSAQGKVFIDYCLSFGALILGHSQAQVVKAIKGAADSGSSFGAPTSKETELAAIISAAIPSIKRLRFTNSGTEAVMTAIRLARAFSGKGKIIKFSGSYHGHADYLLNSAGVPKDFTKHTLIAPYNDAATVERIIKKESGKIAAIIVEPIEGNSRVVLPQNGFLPSLRRIADKHGIILIFDEVITGFRFTFGGAQDYFKVTPDLTVLGKIIGGGLPIGAVGGKKEIMDLLAPLGEVYQAGTFSGNPLSMAAGLSALKILAEKSFYDKLNTMSYEFCRSIQQIFKARGKAAEINFMGAMFNIKLNRFNKFYHHLLKEGVYFPPSAQEACFLSCAHSRKDLENTLMAIDKALKKCKTNTTLRRAQDEFKPNHQR